MDQNRAYKLEKIKSASDLEALIMIYEEMIESLEISKKSFEEKDVKLCEEKTSWVIKALEALASLLNFEPDPGLAGNLYRIYEYILVRLTVAKSGIRQTVPLLEECISLLSGLKDSWVQAKDRGDVTAKFRINSTSEERNLLNIQI